MTRPHNGPNNLPVRRTMIKDTIGQVRKPAYDLPDQKNSQHIYGQEVKKDIEDAGQVIGKWVQSKPSPAAKSTRSFVETNRRALEAGCTTAKGNRGYATEHPNIRERPPQRRQPGAPSPADASTTYGVKSGERENLTELIQSQNSGYHEDDPDYPDLSTMTIKGKLPLPRETKTSLLKDKRFETNTATKEPFKMKKFQKVHGIISTQPNKSSKTMHAQLGGSEEIAREDD